jgi:hypothetical protein
MMGDHSNAIIAIPCLLRGTVVGVSANIFGSGFPRNFVPSFHGEVLVFLPNKKKAFETARIVMSRRNLVFDE